ncbi:hypothetical protein [Celerinatantimonas sp. YJH-8]|uniref:hypothetical protein n=1 Tax=Celerinatantimonas sp. YJH-8 TaxID=3228714 RepID=UPI0038C252FF
MQRILWVLSLIWLFISLNLQAAELSAYDYQQLQQADKLIEQQLYPQAKIYLNDYLKRLGSNDRPSYPQALAQLALGRIALAEDHYSQAYPYFNQAYQGKVLPEAQQLSLLLTLAQLDLNLEHWQQGVIHLQQWFKQAPPEQQKARHYQLLAFGQYQLKHWTDGLAAMRQAFSMRNNPPQNWYNLGVALAIANHSWPQAIQWQSHLVELDPQSMQQWQQLAALQMRNHQSKAALATMRLAWQRGLFNRTDHYQLLAQLANTAKIPYLAAQVLDDGIDKHVVKANISHVRWLAGLWIQARQFDQAIDRYQQLCQLEPTRQNYHQYLSLLANQQRWKELLQNATLAERHVQSPRIDLLKGIAATQLQKYTQAEQFFKQAKRSEQYASSSQSWMNYIQQIR